MTAHAVIAGYLRSPFAPATKGRLARVRPDDLAARVVAALVERAGVDPEAIDDLVMGCAFPEGEQGLNLGRMVALAAGLPDSVPGVTVNRWCGSSMQAVHMAAGQIAAGAGRLFIAAGVESMSRVPMMGFNPMPNPALVEKLPSITHSMGRTAETLARRYGIARKEQEAFALRSHQRAAAAWAAGRYAGDVVAIDGPGGPVAEDGAIRPDTSLEALAALPPAFDAEGTVTAGTSSPLTDGAAAVLVAEEGFARAAGLPLMARVRSMAVTGCAPEIMGIGPVAASRLALERAGLRLDEIDLVELNEAFAAQVIAVGRELGLDWDRTNRDGGAIALGHPLGASGARIVGTAARMLAAGEGALALATLCIGGGQGMATVLEAVRG